MSDTIDTGGPFVYQAQTDQGQSISGTIDASSIEHAQQLLAGLRLRVLEIARSAKGSREAGGTQAVGKALRADDFIAFNQQLAHLTSAGMPVEQGLRLIAADLRHGRLAATVREVADELERGTPLEQAFEKYRDRFPPLYSRLVGAGVSSGSLSGMLLNLGRHMELVQRLRSAVWRAAAYPLMVLVCVVLVVTFVGLRIIPRFEVIFRDFGTKLPKLTELIMQLPLVLPWMLGAVAAVILIAVVGWLILRSTGRDRAVTETLGLASPFIGPILRYNLLARWTDAVSVGVHAGLDLPRAIELADDAVASPKLIRDGNLIVAALNAGKPLDSVSQTRLIPATVLAAISLASKNNDLPAALTALSEMYQQQARNRTSLLPGLLTPILLIIVAIVIGLIVLAMFLPLIALIQNITSPMGK